MNTPQAVNARRVDARTQTPAEDDALAVEAARLSASGAIGRSGKLADLFAYLLRCTAQGRAPKEVEVAMNVFGRPADFDPARDAVVRVYAHKLRTRLAAAYAGADPETPRLSVSRGEYRLSLQAGASVSTASQPPDAGRRRWMQGAGVAAAVALAGGAGWALGHPWPSRTERERDALRRGPLWGPLLANGRPTTIAVGDYFIFGETTPDGMEVARLVREYTVNSAQDLSDFLRSHPDKAGRYLDLDLRYLPIGAAPALRQLAAILEDGRPADRLSVVIASALTPEALTGGNVVYVGYFSGLGRLRSTALSGSRFDIGETFDEIIDRRTGRRYASQGGGRDQDGAIYRDYGYVSSLAAPGGGRMVVVAGTRDAGLMQAALEAAGPRAIEAAFRGAVSSSAREALYEVDGMNRTNVGGRLVVAAAFGPTVRDGVRSQPTTGL